MVFYTKNKVNNNNNNHDNNNKYRRKNQKIFLQLWCFVNFQHISQLFLMFLLLNLNK